MMTSTRNVNSYTLFRCFVLPAMFLCSIFRKPVFQWIAVAALVIWVVIMVCGGLSKGLKRSHQKRKNRKNREQAAEHAAATVEQTVSAAATAEEANEKNGSAGSESDLMLIRHINCRVTEQLKEAYPDASWLWTSSPTVEGICRGGTWRIKVFHADPFNYAEVLMNSAGRLSITMIQAVMLKDAVDVDEAKDDLQQSELLDRVDVKSWYHEQGEAILAQLVDDLNSQGHKQLVIKEDGEVVLSTENQAQVLSIISNFPPRKVWEDFCMLLKEDEITATVKPEGLAIAWQ